jgi:hypothetical protein
MGGTPRASAISRATACFVAGDAPHRRVDEVEFCGCQRQRFPVEAAFEQERTTGVFGTLEALLQFGFEAFELFRAEAAFAGGVDQCTGGADYIDLSSVTPLTALKSRNSFLCKSSTAAVENVPSSAA